MATKAQRRRRVEQRILSLARTAKWGMFNQDAIRAINALVRLARQAWGK